MNYEERKLIIIERATGDLTASLPDFADHFQTIAELKKTAVDSGYLEQCQKLSSLRETLEYVDNFRREMLTHREAVLMQVTRELEEKYRRNVSKPRLKVYEHTAFVPFSSVGTSGEFVFLGERFSRTAENKGKLHRDGTEWDFEADDKVVKTIGEENGENPGAES